MTREQVTQAVSDLNEWAKKIDEENGNDSDIYTGMPVHTLTEGIVGGVEHVESNFQLWSGSSKPEQHHYGDHGLLIHTHEVVKTCLHVRELYPQYEIDKTELFLSAIYHDTGKMYDYSVIQGNPPFTENEWVGTEHKRKIHHISRSAIIWSKKIEKIANQKFRSTYEDKVLHAILSHHGQRAWGSPVAPKSRVAWLLHLCDGISARLYDADTWDRY